MQSLVDKWRFGSMLKQTEVVISLDPHTPLSGAARYAQHRLYSTTRYAKPTQMKFLAIFP